MIWIDTAQAEPVRPAIILDPLRQFLTNLKNQRGSRSEQNDAENDREEIGCQVSCKECSRNSSYRCSQFQKHTHAQVRHVFFLVGCRCPAGSSNHRNNTCANSVVNRKAEDKRQQGYDQHATAKTNERT